MFDLTVLYFLKKNCSFSIKKMPPFSRHRITNLINFKEKKTEYLSVSLRRKSASACGNQYKLRYIICWTELPTCFAVIYA